MRGLHLRDASLILRDKAFDKPIIAGHGHPFAVSGTWKDQSPAGSRLRRAEKTADALGTDANHLWTAFGHTNVRIHRVTAAMALGVVPTTLDLIPGITTAHLPVERGPPQP
jgi:hypothetical protein